MTTTDEARARLHASRAALLQAIGGLTDREFAAELEPAVTVLSALARLAPAEREAVGRARATAGLPPRPRPAAAGPALTRAVPPQVIHDLAGARYETLAFLDQLPAGPLLTGGGPLAGSEHETPETLLEAIAQREEAAARQIAAVPRGSPGPAPDPGITIQA